MTVEYIRYRCADKERREDLLQAYRKAAKVLDAAPECLAYEMSVCEEDEQSAVLRIEWESTEAHLQGFRQSARFRDFFTFSAIGDFVNEIAEMRHYALTDIKRR
jgi:quinol monooxygenase YgiN